MFVGRERELSELNRLYRTDKFQFAVVYGRRRVGKTALISEFIKDKKTIFFTGEETISITNLENLSTSIYMCEHGNITAPVFTGYREALDHIYSLSKKEKIVVVIDEYPYLAKSEPGISSLFQVQIDHKFKYTNMFLIMCGSSMSFMEKQVLGYKSPLYGRRTAQFKIQPFEFFETKKFFKKFNPKDLATVYGITGGIPQYLSQIDENLSVKENIKNAFLSPSAFLFEEPSNLLKQEVREPAFYNAIIKSIATGSSRNSEISSKVGLESGTCTKYLNNLIDLGIVKKELPILETSNKKTIYSINDSMFKFWYKFIPQILPLIQRGFTDDAFIEIESQISGFMGNVFEEICKQYLWKERGQDSTPIKFVDMGRWWGNDPVNKCESEIDILAYKDKKSAIFAECKWTNEKVDLKILEELIQKSKLFRYENNYFYIFAKTGFTRACEDKAIENKNIKLINFNEMMS